MTSSALEKTPEHWTGATSRLPFGAGEQPSDMRATELIATTHLRATPAPCLATTWASPLGWCDRGRGGLLPAPVSMFYLTCDVSVELLHRGPARFLDAHEPAGCRASRVHEARLGGDAVLGEIRPAADDI